MHYHIISNTPGYIPDEDPYRVETEDDARYAVKEDVDHWTDDSYMPGWVESLCDNYCDDVCLVKHEIYDVTFFANGQSAFIHDRTKTYDLGRVIYADPCNDDDCPMDDDY